MYKNRGGICRAFRPVFRCFQRVIPCHTEINLKTNEGTLGLDHYKEEMAVPISASYVYFSSSASYACG
jgi:hypothetical protein